MPERFTTARKFSRAHALQLLDAISEQAERNYAIASVLVDRLKPQEEETGGDLVPYIVAQALEERMESNRPLKMMRDYLESLGVSNPDVHGE